MDVAALRGRREVAQLHVFDEPLIRLTNKRLGLLINFNVALIKDGITRIANGLPD